MTGVEDHGGRAVFQMSIEEIVGTQTGIDDEIPAIQTRLDEHL